jgi:predicted RND superfamily exporter protein
LLVGTILSLGWLTITIGHLNLLSATFAVMLIGLGDYGVLWVSAFDEYRKKGITAEESIKKTALSVGPGILTAACTTSLAFFAAMLARNLLAYASSFYVPQIRARCAVDVFLPAI